VLVFPYQCLKQRRPGEIDRRAFMFLVSRSC
jgi:hypothetical protein